MHENSCDWPKSSNRSPAKFISDLASWLTWQRIRRPSSTSTKPGPATANMNAAAIATRMRGVNFKESITIRVKANTAMRSARSDCLCLHVLSLIQQNRVLQIHLKLQTRWLQEQLRQNQHLLHKPISTRHGKNSNRKSWEWSHSKLYCNLALSKQWLDTDQDCAASEKPLKTSKQDSHEKLTKAKHWKSQDHSKLKR